MIIEDKEGCGFAFTLRHYIVESTIFMELIVTNELIHFADSIDWSISMEQAGQVARYAASPTCNDYLLEIGDTDEFGFWRIGKGYSGCELTYEFLAYDEIIFSVTVPLNDEEFDLVLKSLGIIEYW